MRSVERSVISGVIRRLRVTSTYEHPRTAHREGLGFISNDADSSTK